MPLPVTLSFAQYRLFRGKILKIQQVKLRDPWTEISWAFIEILGFQNRPTGVASHTKSGHLIELKYVPILKIYMALDKNDSFLIV